MIHMGFFEITLVLVVALLVLGPKRLPKVARTVGRLLGSGRKFWRHVKNEVDDLEPTSNTNTKSDKRDADE